MRRGQATLEYVYLIGIAAVALIAMLVYISRGYQGNIRALSNQVSEDQYSPGQMNSSISETTILNSESTSVNSLNAGSLTAQTSHFSGTQTVDRQTTEDIATLDKE